MPIIYILLAKILLEKNIQKYVLKKTPETLSALHLHAQTHIRVLYRGEKEDIPPPPPCCVGGGGADVRLDGAVSGPSAEAPVEGQPLHLRQETERGREEGRRRKRREGRSGVLPDQVGMYLVILIALP